jgi:hypothetical protein
MYRFQGNSEENAARRCPAVCRWLNILHVSSKRTRAGRLGVLRER